MRARAWIAVVFVGLASLGVGPAKAGRHVLKAKAGPYIRVGTGRPPSGGPQQAPSGTTRTYYIAADELRWDYAPRGRHLTGAPIAEPDDAVASPTTFVKAVYREYTDDTFKTLKPRPPQWEHLGVLGPLIRAEIGDTVRIVFRNQTNIFCSMHPHGLAYDKASEGALYDDGTSGADRADDLIKPGGSHIYTWRVPPRAGPGPGDGSSMLWMYHSHFVEPKDMNTGLFGAIIIGTPNDVDREFVLAFAVFDETASAYAESNLRLNGRRPFTLKATDPAFRLANLVYTINGFIEGNLPTPTMKAGERVRWYLLSNSNEEDIHAVHWHGQTATFMHMRTDVVSLGPMAMGVADMVPDAIGTWLIHCHVNDHFERGMQGLFNVTR
jgi:FtsP/CotA-like multicopper oxidase with cupredoxin domain